MREKVLQMKVVKRKAMTVWINPVMMKTLMMAVKRIPSQTHRKVQSTHCKLRLSSAK
jgi:hypothetical protein